MRRLIQRPTGFRIAFYQGVIVTALGTFLPLLLFGIGSVKAALNPLEPAVLFSAAFVICGLVGGVANMLPLIVKWVMYRRHSRS